MHSDNAFGKGMLGAMTQMGPARGLEITPVLMGDAAGEVDKAMKVLTDSTPQAFVSLFAGASINGTDLLRAMRTKSAVVPGYTILLLAAPSSLAQLGNSATNLTVSQVVPFPYTAKSELVRRYQATMRKNNDAKFSHASLEGYISASVLSFGLKTMATPFPASVL